MESVLINGWNHHSSRWRWAHLFQWVVLLRTTCFSTQWFRGIRISRQIVGYISPSNNSACEVQACNCNVLSRFWSAVFSDTNQVTTGRISENASAFRKVTQTPRAESLVKLQHLCYCVNKSEIDGAFVGAFLVCVFVTERDEATTESSDHNATSITEVDKRVKRRLLMGNICTPQRLTNNLSFVLHDGVLNC